MCSGTVLPRKRPHLHGFQLSSFQDNNQPLFICFDAGFVHVFGGKIVFLVVSLAITQFSFISHAGKNEQFIHKIPRTDHARACVRNDVSVKLNETVCLRFLYDENVIKPRLSLTRNFVFY